MERQKEVISPLTSRLNGSAQSAKGLLLVSLTYQIKGKSLRGKTLRLTSLKRRGCHLLGVLILK